MNEGIIIKVKEDKYNIIWKNSINIKKKTYFIYVYEDTLEAQLFTGEKEFTSDIDLKFFENKMCDIKLDGDKIASVIYAG